MQGVINSVSQGVCVSSALQMWPSAAARNVINQPGLRQPASVALLVEHLEEEHRDFSPFTEKAIPRRHYQSDLLILLTTSP